MLHNLVVNLLHNSISPYLILQQYNLPRAVLPKGIISQDYDSSNGKLTVRLHDSCSYKIEEVQLKFQYILTCVLTIDNISYLEGALVQVSSNEWRTLEKVTRVNDKLKFIAGDFQREASLSNFLLNPECVCLCLN
ncbi:hypothetical protein Lalb_Chr20g0108931 [Lupinus albus]|uniref:Uncharacterized protein n=1 Tax=Lupinus albus TaxID=3870 RepID=A0A6A4NER8_LUPAL|nr:hypothetical protein Lalb_Chr20g0108931 [Lupinus albus]